MLDKFDIPNSTCMQEVGDTPILEVIPINRNMIVSEGMTLLTAVHDSWSKQCQYFKRKGKKSR